MRTLDVTDSPSCCVERHGVPDEAWDLIDDAIEIPMIGRGSSLNVAVTGSLVLYRLAAMA